MKIREFIRFEWQYRRTRPATYIYFFLMILIGFAVSFGAEKIFNVPGLIKINAPAIIDQMFGMSLVFAMIVLSAVTGVAILRDYQHGTASLFFTKPISRREYLIGRFIGVFTFCCLLYTGVIIGMWIPEVVPIRPNLLYNLFNPLTYFRSFLFVALPAVFFLCSLFFMGGALSKRTQIIYLQGFIMFIFFSILDESLVEILPNRNLAAILDFFLVQAIGSRTEFWSIAEQNTQLIHYNGTLLINRLILVLLGITFLFFTIRKFQPFTDKKSKKKKA